MNNKLAILFIVLLVNVYAALGATEVAAATAENNKPKKLASKSKLKVNKGPNVKANSMGAEGKAKKVFSKAKAKNTASQSKANIRALDVYGEANCDCIDCPAFTSSQCDDFSSYCNDGYSCTAGDTTAECYYSGYADDDYTCSDLEDACASECSSTYGCNYYYFDCEGFDDGSSNDCFHESTMITYKGKSYSLADLQAGKEPECRIPHTPNSRGVVVSAKCGDQTHKLRVTDTHLVATSKGFQLAYSLQSGDVVFNDIDGKSLCTVTSVSKEPKVERYFGLNCLSSEVLADGIKSSTFGDFHTLPSWYMSYAGSLVGVDTASYVGAYIAEWYLGPPSNKTN